MALIKCGECGHMISDKAIACPKCGCPSGTTNEIRRESELSHVSSYNTGGYGEQYPEGAPKKSRKTLIVAACAAAVAVLGILYFWQIRPANSDARAQNDSIAALSPEQQRINSLYANFTTPDLNTFQAKGYVKSISMKMLDISWNLTQSLDVQFDTAGVVTNASTTLKHQSSPTQYNLYITRNGKYINSMSFANRNYGAMAESGTMTFAYGQDLLKKFVYIYEANTAGQYDMCRVDIDYSEFDKQSLPTHITFHDGKCGFGAHTLANNWKVYSTYDAPINYTKFDNYGNWTELTLKGTRISRDKDGLTGQISEAHPSPLSTTVTRTITYYSPEEIFGKNIPK